MTYIMTNLKAPNIVFLLADQWRGQATGYAGDPNAKTPHVDALARESFIFRRAFSGIPVCTPARACLMTGKYPIDHGVFLNDVYLKPDETSIARVLRKAGYDTAYIGKWHLDGHGSRSTFIPEERRQGFKYWKALECTHAYFDSRYHDGNDQSPKKWDGYDALAQTRDAVQYIRTHDKDKPFFLFLSWGPPHNPYQDAPREYKKNHTPRKIELRPNVPKEMKKRARKDLAGYYAHISALDACVGMVVRALDEAGLAGTTILIFTSDHGDMLCSQGQQRKQRPWDESISIPMLARVPSLHGRGVEISMPVDLADLMPTMLGLCNIPIPPGIAANDLSKHLAGKEMPEDNPVLLSCISPFGEFTVNNGGREFRGIRTCRYTYVRDLKGPWLLYDNEVDPFQLRNLVNDEQYAILREKLGAVLDGMLARRGDGFRPSREYIQKWGHVVNETGTVPYTE